MSKFKQKTLEGTIANIGSGDYPEWVRQLTPFFKVISQTKEKGKSRTFTMTCITCGGVVINKGKERFVDHIKVRSSNLGWNTKEGKVQIIFNIYSHIFFKLSFR